MLYFFFNFPFFLSVILDYIRLRQQINGILWFWLSLLVITWSDCLNKIKGNDSIVYDVRFLHEETAFVSITTQTSIPWLLSQLRTFLRLGIAWLSNANVYLRLPLDSLVALMSYQQNVFLNNIFVCKYTEKTHAKPSINPPAIFLSGINSFRTRYTFPLFAFVLNINSWSFSFPLIWRKVLLQQKS